MTPLRIGLTFGLLTCAMMVVRAMPPEDKPGVVAEGKARVTTEEARGRTRLLHDFVHTTLQVVHNEYYRENERLSLPANTLETVFDELAERRGVTLKWIAVNARAMNIDHEARSDFEKRAAEALKSGKSEYESVENGVYRRAGPVTLSAGCLKCHLPSRSSNDDRLAGLVISMPIKTP